MLNNYHDMLKAYFRKHYGTTDKFNEILSRFLSVLDRGGICVPITSEETNYLNQLDLVGIDKPLVIFDNNLYFQKYYMMEQTIVSKVRALIALKKLSIITGGPGTGKTTSLSKALAKLLSVQQTLTIGLAAPTGKAAVRMKEAIKNTLTGSSYSVEAMLENEPYKAQVIDKLKTVEVHTIHHLLGARPLYTDYKYQNTFLDKDIIVIDEASMIDIELMYKLLHAINPDDIVKLFLVGDKDQITSVDVGSIFKDLIDVIEDDHVVTKLEKNYRSKNALGIQNLINDIKSEKLTDINQSLYAPEVSFEYQFKVMLEHPFINQMVLAYQKALSVTDALALISKRIVLSAYRRGLVGSKAINYSILNHYKDLRYIPYMVLENDYSKDLYNGDVGILDKSNYQIYFSEEKSFNLNTLKSCEPAFCMTIHKSQGSEYDEVLLIFGQNQTDDTFITKELIYTGVSRAKEKLSILSDKDTLISGLKQSILRHSGIKEGRL